MTGRTLARFEHEAMTTLFEVAVAGEEASYARQAAQAVFAEIDRVERLLSRFDPASELSQVNRLAPGESLAGNVDLFECLEAARAAWRETGGLFDPSLGATTKPGAAPLRRAGMESLLLNVETPAGDGGPRRFRVGLAADAPGPLSLDLGGVGKGFALDCAGRTLQDWGLENVLLGAGASTALARGDGPEGGGWRLGVGGPWAEDAAQARIVLSTGALSGSGAEVKGEHVVDPRTGRRERRALAAWALCASAARSDALATAFLLMTPEEAEAFCAAHPDASACVVGRDGAPRFFGPAFTF